jgi:molecular chaperone GrpE
MSSKKRKGHPEEEDPVKAGLEAEPVAEPAVLPPEQTWEYWKDQYLRAIAELQNVRRRGNQEVDERVVQRMEGLLVDLLRVDDYFAAALSSIPASVQAAEGSASFLAGVQAIRQALDGVLAAHGLQFLEPGPQAIFDPAEHEAVEVVMDANLSAPRVELLARGCRMGRRILRPARVRLHQPAAAPAQ